MGRDAVPKVPTPSVVAAQFALLADPLRLAIVEGLAREHIARVT